MDMFAKYHELVEGAYRDKKLSQTCYESMINKSAIDLYELDHLYAELTYFIANAEYYITLDRITKGEEMLAAEMYEAKKSGYRKLLNDLTTKLDNLIPKGESA